MFNTKLIARIKRLEDLVDRLYNERNCASGKHVWEAKPSWDKEKPPYIICKHCNVRPPKVEQ